ncbi:hypothetical protein N7535_002835 [Penicillium sp. DV-2018c]|nr:hypothetical protein N7461_001481 [Penicillium sp. DV-2018c]KAJ5575909.1 hypothetical protein N7535_002835 [Penicillium sp. DV-2018c]
MLGVLTDAFSKPTLEVPNGDCGACGLCWVPRPTSLLDVPSRSFGYSKPLQSELLDTTAQAWSGIVRPGSFTLKGPARCTLTLKTIIGDLIYVQPGDTSILLPADQSPIVDTNPLLQQTSTRGTLSSSEVSPTRFFLVGFNEASILQIITISQKSLGSVGTSVVCPGIGEYGRRWNFRCLVIEEHMEEADRWANSGRGTCALILRSQEDSNAHRSALEGIGDSGGGTLEQGDLNGVDTSAVGIWGIWWRNSGTRGPERR